MFLLLPPNVPDRPPRVSFRQWAKRQPWGFWVVFWLVVAVTVSILAEQSGLAEAVRGWLPLQNRQTSLPP